MFKNTDQYRLTKKGSKILPHIAKPSRYPLQGSLCGGFPPHLYRVLWDELLPNVARTDLVFSLNLPDYFQGFQKCHTPAADGGTLGARPSQEKLQVRPLRRQSSYSDSERSVPASYLVFFGTLSELEAGSKLLRGYHAFSELEEKLCFKARQQSGDLT